MTALCLIPIIMLYAAGNITAARAAYKHAPRLLPALIFACAPAGTAAGLIFAAVKSSRERAQLYRAVIKIPTPGGSLPACGMRAIAARASPPQKNGSCGQF
mgnify:FL=1